MKTVTVSTRNFCFNLCSITSYFQRDFQKMKTLLPTYGALHRGREREREKPSSFQLRSNVTLYSSWELQVCVFNTNHNGKLTLLCFHLLFLLNINLECEAELGNWGPC